jgi:hypothetical protein
MEGGADKHSKAIRQYKGSHLAEITKKWCRLESSIKEMPAIKKNNND